MMKRTTYQRSEDISQEIGIFEVCKQTKINSKAKHNTCLTFPAYGSTCHKTSNKEIAYRDKCQQEKVRSATFFLKFLGECCYKQ